MAVGALCWAGALAQPLPPEAAEALEQGRQAAARARVAYAEVINHVDQPLWREAMRQGEAALQLAPEHPEVLRFLAETYGFLHWDIRAWGHWLRYYEVVGEFDAEAAEQAAKAGNELGYARYQAGDFAGALDYYAQVFELTGNREALVWLGRIHFEQGDPQALAYYQQLVELDPADATARYFLARSQQRIELGVEVSDAFHAGLVHYEAGELEAALQAFEATAQLAGHFKEAYVWAGRTALELGRPQVARRHWQQVLALDPGDERARYFLTVADAQLAYGVEAVQAFYAGLERYEQGDLEGALERMQAAVRANPRYEEASNWIGRLFAELGRPQQAIAYWEARLAADPNDRRARYFLNLARDQVEFGVAAASALSRGLTSYQLADFAAAEAAFREAIALNPEYTDAWAWLGRLAFDQARFAQAAEYYGRAAQLEPENDAYRFFAAEAARLANPAPPAEDDGG